jgi:hypothetical protein
MALGEKNQKKTINLPVIVGSRSSKVSIGVYRSLKPVVVDDNWCS